jgi:hypothetical protein
LLEKLQSARIRMRPRNCDVRLPENGISPARLAAETAVDFLLKPAVETNGESESPPRMGHFPGRQEISPTGRLIGGLRHDRPATKRLGYEPLGTP